MVTADLDRRCCLCHQGQPKGAARLRAAVRIAPSDWNERYSISFRSIYATYANSKCLLDSLSTPGPIECWGQRYLMYAGAIALVNGTWESSSLVSKRASRDEGRARKYP